MCSSATRDAWPERTRHKIRTALIGFGHFGRKRAAAIQASARSDLVLVADTDADRARSAARDLGCEYTTDCEQAILRPDVEVVVIATPSWLCPGLILEALRSGKHVLCEKPFGRTADEVLPAVEMARQKNLRIKVGYNHRYHPALFKAHELYSQGTIGRGQFIRCNYGHGGRSGYDKEWRTNPSVAGGGQLLDQGVHALDLFQWFFGPFNDVVAFAATLFWQIAPLEDNIFALLRTAGGQVASLHASWTNWKNVFSFEVFGEHGFLLVQGLGGSYGPERLCVGIRRNLGSCPEETWFDFPEADTSLQQEWEVFIDAVVEGHQPPSSGEESMRSLQLVDAIYESAKSGCAVRLPQARHSETHSSVLISEQK